MIRSSMATFPSLLLSLVLVFHEAHSVQADSWCANSKTSQPLSFQWLSDERKEYNIDLLEGFVLEIQCCVVSTNPSVSWLFNGKPIAEYGELFELSEKRQVVKSAGDALIDNKVLAGVYNCTAVDGNETLSAAYIIWRQSARNETCTQGKTTNIPAGHPPRSLYQVASSSSLTLECTAEMICHSLDVTQELYWIKYYVKGAATKTQPASDDDDDSRVSSYFLLGPNSSDSETGDYVNVTSKRLAYGRWLVTAILYIANVTDDDLHDTSNPDRYYNVSCRDDDAACVTNRTKNYYKCGYIGAGTRNPVQNALVRSRIVTLFSGTAPLTSPPQMMAPSGPFGLSFLSLTPANSSSVVAMWEPPSRWNGVPGGYIITIFNGQRTFRAYYTKSANDTKHQFVHLQPSTYYEVQLIAFNDLANSSVKLLNITTSQQSGDSQSVSIPKNDELSWAISATAVAVTSVSVNIVLLSCLCRLKSARGQKNKPFKTEFC